MKKVVLIFLSCAIFLTSYSQENYSIQENRITQYEMEMTEYPKDSEAEAVVIYEKGDYRFVFSDAEGFILRMTIHTKVKILSHAGEKYATFEIPIYHTDSRTTERLDDITGMTYNEENGELIKTEFIAKENIFNEIINENWDLKKFTLPNVKAGSVIEVKYTIETPFFVNMREWRFQKNIPVIYSKLSYKAIPYYEYVYSATNINKFDEYSETPLNQEFRHGSLVYKEMEHIFALKEIPAFRDEEFISASKDYMISLNFQLARIYYPNGGQVDYISTWEALSKDLLKDQNFGKYINNAKKEAKKILPTLELSNKSEKEKIKIITEYVKNNFNWDGFYGKYATQKVSNLIKTKRGNVADINLFLTGMLDEAGINVSPIILSTRDHGRINKSYPFMQYFNYTIAEITTDNLNIHIDATEPMLPDKVVPPRCVNTEALVIEKEPRWTFIRQKAISFLHKELDIHIKSVDEVEIKALYASIGQNAYLYRTKYMGKKEDLIKYLKEGEDVVVENGIQISNYKTLEKPFLFKFTFHTIAEGNEDKIFINPFSNLFHRDNLFKQTERTFPVDLNELISGRFIAKINIPNGYKVDFVPESLNFNNDLMQINYKQTVTEKAIEIDLYYSFNDYIYSAEKYSELKKTYAMLLSKLTDMIIFSKK